MNPFLFEKHLYSIAPLSPGDTVIVGVSGGPDSICLLKLLCQMKQSLTPVAIYVNHGLRPQETPREKQVVEELARRCQVTFEEVCVDVEGYRKKHKKGLEDAARELRYRAFADCMSKHKATAILVAHTADDQAEEILLRLIRGTGRKGLGGMEEVTNSIIRPLLKTSKADILTHLAETNEPYCYDSSNDDTNLLRNRIRHQLLPFLEEKFNPSIKNGLRRIGSVLASEEEFLEQQTEKLKSQCVTETAKNMTIDLTILHKSHPALQRRLMEKIFWTSRTPPSFELIEDVLDLARNGQNGAECHLAGGVRVTRSAGQLHFIRLDQGGRHNIEVATAMGQPIVIPGPGEYRVENLGRTLSLTEYAKPPSEHSRHCLLLEGKQLSYPMTLRNHLPGEKFRPAGMSGHTTVSRFLANQKIPRHLRNHYPVLISQERIVCIVGLRADHSFAADSTSTVLLCCWHEDHT